ncbi:MAG: F0F1 ATP synthase subunit A [Pseudoflavonifractor sp.]|nr:F0F1 ATP synthase subunit A [Pseudoflavonifractor sp.]
MKRIFLILAVMLAAVVYPAALSASDADSGEKVNPKEIIFEHLGDGYGWEVPFNHHVRIPLPIIVRDYKGDWHLFSSSRLTGGDEYDGFRIGGEDSAHKGKVIGFKPGPDGTLVEYRPWDFSITKNVLAAIIAALVVFACCMSVAHWYKTRGYKAPRKGVGFMEVCIDFVYRGVIVPTLKENARRFAPYLLTVFFFILVMNLLGLIVIFPGGANLTGNIAVTLVLALFTFFITNIFGTKHYWKEIFWPDVPLWLKFPLPIMPIIELFGIFTKPAALTVRLFANMMGGHMIVLVLIMLIFIFAAMGPVVTGATTVVSIIFSLFMLLIDVLVSFIQAYVFTMLSTIFVALAQEKEHEKHEKKTEENNQLNKSQTL